MPTKKEAMERPTNLGEVITPATPYAQNVPPIIPREQPGLSPASLGPAPALWTTEYDKVRQWHRPGTSQGRFPALPTKANPQINASSSSVATKKLAPVRAQTSQNSALIAALQKQGWQGGWSNAVTYVKGSITEFAGVVYISLQDQNLNNEPDISGSFWTSTGTDQFLGAWSSTTAYVIGNIVSVGSALYLATANSTNQNPTTTSGFWSRLTGNSIYEGTWSSSFAYSVGQTVSYVDGNFYICVVANTNVAPVPTGSTDWVLLGTSNTLIGAYSGATAYVAGNQVTNAGNIFQALQSTTGNAPPTPPTTSAFWLLIGPSTLDSLTDGLSYTRTPLFGSAAISIPNANFEAPAVGTSIPGWQGSSATLSLATAGPYSGNQSLQVNATSQFGGAVTQTTQKWACNPGDQFFVSAAMKSDGTSQPRFSIIFFGITGGFIGGVTASHGTGTSWSISTATGTAPAGTIGMYLDCDNAATSGAGVAYFDALLADRIVDPTTTLKAAGSTPQNLSTGFTFSSTPTTVTVSWTSLQIFRADGSTTAVPNGSQTVTGLTASSSFRMYPYFDDLASSPTFGTLQFVSVAGGTGSPAICYASGSNLVTQAQNLQSRTPLSSSTGLVVTTPASGSSGGSGGGSSNCLHESMLCATQRGILPIIDVMVGDKVLGEHDEWQEVTYKKVKPCEVFISILLTNGSSIVASPTHPFTLPDRSMVRAQDLSLSNFLITRGGGVGVIKSISVLEQKARKVTLTVEPNHTFLAGKDSPGIISHNWLPS